MPMLPDAKARVVATDRQVACEVGGEAVILHLDEGVYYGLNEVGARVWQLVQKPLTLAEIVDAIVAEYEVERGQCLSDIQQLVAGLAEHKLVIVSDEAPA
jgi:hypothetical protein